MTFEEILKLLPKPYYQDDAVAIYHADCRDILPLIPDKSIDLVLTDPPYGKMWTRGENGIGVDKKSNEDDKTSWDIKPTKLVFEAMVRSSENQIIFGGQYFTDILPISNCWIVWDKRGNFPRGKQIPFADCELAWTSFNKTIKKYSLRIQGFVNDSCDERVHPTQKPSELFNWILDDYAKQEALILDPFLGSGTTAYCAKKLGRKCIGIEIEEKYCEIAAKRLSQAVMSLEIPKEGLTDWQGDFLNFDSLPKNP